MYSVNKDLKDNHKPELHLQIQNNSDNNKTQQEKQIKGWRKHEWEVLLDLEPPKRPP